MRLNNNGKKFFSVIATIQIGASQPPENYTRTFDVTVAYN